MKIVQLAKNNLEIIICNVFRDKVYQSEKEEHLSKNG